MSNVLYQKVLSLNSLWQPIGLTTVKKALEDMNSGKTPKLALKIEYVVGENGEPDYSLPPTEIYPMKWDEWIMLHPRRHDEHVIRSVNLEVRVPRVIISPNYSKVPLKTFRPTKMGIFNRDGGVCAYSGVKLTKARASIDHVFPKSKWKKSGKAGSPDSWENLVLCDKDINFKKADRTPEEAGLKLLIKPKAPQAVPVTTLIKEAIYPDFRHFLFHKA